MIILTQHRNLNWISMENVCKQLKNCKENCQYAASNENNIDSLQLPKMISWISKSLKHSACWKLLKCVISRKIKFGAIIEVMHKNRTAKLLRVKQWHYLLRLEALDRSSIAGVQETPPTFVWPRAAATIVTSRTRHSLDLTTWEEGITSVY